MKNLKKIIVIILIIILVLIITIYLINKKNIFDEESNIKESEYIEGSYEGNNVITEIENREDYFIIKSILENLQVYINYLDYDFSQSRNEFNNIEEQEEALEKYKEEGIDIIKNNIMSKEYIEKFNINDNEIYQKLVKYANKNIIINNIYVCDNSENIKTYIVYSNTAETNEEFNIVIVTDSLTNSFNIILDNYIDNMKINKENIIGTEVSQDISNIKENEYNIYEDPDVSNKIYVQELFENYKNYLINSSKKAYELLDNEYKKIKFKDINEFNEYIDNNSSRIEDMEISKYKINSYSDYTEYICVDQYENYIIFRENKVMNYTAILDIYTVDIPELVEKYNKGNEKEKVAMNIEKILSAINDKDYNYVYDKLDDTFKNNKFDTVEKFELYIKQNMFDTNIAEYGNFSNEGETYIYELNIKLSEESEDIKHVTVIMKLLEDNNFVMSFNIQ